MLSLAHVYPDEARIARHPVAMQKLQSTALEMLQAIQYLYSYSALAQYQAWNTSHSSCFTSWCFCVADPVSDDFLPSRIAFTYPIKREIQTDHEDCDGGAVDLDLSFARSTFVQVHKSGPLVFLPQYSAMTDHEQPTGSMPMKIVNTHLPDAFVGLNALSNNTPI